MTVIGRLEREGKSTYKQLRVFLEPVATVAVVFNIMQATKKLAANMSTAGYNQ